MILTLFNIEWLLNLGGRLHPLVVHFPIGLLIGAMILETWSRIRKRETNVAGMIYIGSFGAIISAIFGGLLKASELYEGNLVDQHQWTGYITAGLALFTAGLYWNRDGIPKQLPYITLTISCISLTIASHLGASLTHGEDYLLSALPWNKGEISNDSFLKSIQDFSTSDTLSTDQLDQINLQVRTIFAHHCYKCHSTAKRKGDLALDHEEGVYAGGENGPVFTRGNAGSSELIRRLRLPRSHDDVMPPKGKKLQNEAIEVIELWINQGAHWSDEKLKVFREAALELIQPEIPETPTEITHPIDKFVHSYFERRSIKWPDPIDDRSFIRKAHLDITGLLPSPEAIHHFVEDNATGKRKDLILKLLEDKENYVLHWLSFWNDILRNDYSGTGFITGGRKQISGWLYQSLLEGKPYNQMVAEIINPTSDSEGFIRGIKWRGEVNASQRVELQAAQNISQSLLGLNLKCASCHNSFINNISLEQAYGFANIFAEEPLEIYRCDKPTGRMAKSSFIYPQLGQVQSEDLQGRLSELEAIIVQPQNGRLYRTLVNRYWDRLFGRGIVAPVDEMDNLPWSQELLDWLAAEFIKGNYDLRKLLATIMTSKAYQLPVVAYPSPEYLTSEQFIFRGPAIRRLSAEQFADAFGQIFAPVYYGLAFDPGDRKSDAIWIWHEEIKLDRRVLPTPGTRYFRKVFSVDEKTPIKSAEVLITADDAFTFYLNDSPLAKGNDWRQVQRIDIPPDRFDLENIIAISADNHGDIPNPAGLLFSLRLQFSDSTFQYMHSDPSWKTNTEVQSENWFKLTHDDAQWRQAWKAGSFQKSYWGSLLDFNFDAPTDQRPLVRASLVRQDDFMKTMGRPVRENVATRRDMEATLLQSLMLTNNAFFHENIARGASSWLEKMDEDPHKLLDEIYLHALGRVPVPKEKKVLLKQLNTQNKLEALQDIIWALLMHPEFQFI